MKKIFRVHYGGTFVRSGNHLRYTGGQVTEIVRTNMQSVRSWDIRKDICGFGYELSEIVVWYCPKGIGLNDGRLALHDQQSLYELYGECFVEGEVDVYVEHSVNEHSVGDDIAEEIGLTQFPSCPQRQEDEGISDGTSYAENNSEFDDESEYNGVDVVKSEENADDETVDNDEVSDVANVEEDENDADIGVESSDTDDEYNENDIEDDADTEDNVEEQSLPSLETVETADNEHTNLAERVLPTQCQPNQIEPNISDEEKEYASDGYPDTVDDSEIEWNNFGRKKQRFPYQSRNTDYRDVKLALFQVFLDGPEFKDAVFKYALNMRYDIKYTRSASNRISAKYGFPGCPWTVYCCKDKSIGKWMIKQFEHEHKCKCRESISLLTCHRLGMMFIDKFRERPEYSAMEMKNDVLRNFKLKVTKGQCRRARLFALESIRGSYKMHFAKLWDYIEEVKSQNPGVHIDVKTVTDASIEGERFQRLYISFPALTIGWIKGCRPVIGLDGCFLKWQSKGELLSAVGRDANNQIFPIAWVVVEVENKDSWSWFIKLLKKDFQLTSGEGLTLITYQQKGLLSAIDDNLTKAEHRMCARHVYANWRKVHKEDILKPMFWDAARCYTVQQFQAKTENIKSRSVPAFHDLMRQGPEHWSRAYFQVHSKCEDVFNNMSESFNNTIRTARTKPIIELLEKLRKMTMKRMIRRRDQSRKCESIVTPRVKTILATNRTQAVECQVWCSDDGLYEVELNGKMRRVDLGAKTCGCRQWQLSGIPCCHAISAIIDERKEPKMFVHEYHTQGAWIRAYKRNIEPVQSEDLWVKTGKEPIQPPHDRIMPRRPHKNRTKDKHESPKGRVSSHGRVVTCTWCWKEGHNKQGCNLKDRDSLPKPTEPPKKIGRPRRQLVLDPEATQGKKRGRGRPRKYTETGSNTGIPSQVIEGTSREITTAPPKRRRGRPRKDSAASISKQPVLSSTGANTSKQLKKKQRRPFGHGLLHTNLGEMIWKDIGGTSRRVA